MNTYTPEQLATVLRAHRAWCEHDPTGRRAELRGAVLRNVDLSGACLVDADLSDAILTDSIFTGTVFTDANLKDADFSRSNLNYATFESARLDGVMFADADLTGVNFSDSSLTLINLREANLETIRADILSILDTFPDEVSGLLSTLRAGNVNGCAYDGKCSCLIGTIARQRKCDVHNLPNCKPDAYRPAERWFLAIRPGHRPDSCKIAEITDEWIAEWMKEHGQPLPLSTEEQLEAALKRIAVLEGLQ